LDITFGSTLEFTLDSTPDFQQILPTLTNIKDMKLLFHQILYDSTSLDLGTLD
jgi:hypothetical protein